MTQTKNGVGIKADWKSNYDTGASHFVFVLDGERIRELYITGA